MLEIANQYDFHTIDESAEGKLKRAVIDQCTRPYGNRVAARDWLPALEQLLKKDPAQSRWLAKFLLAELVETDDDVKAAGNAHRSLRRAGGARRRQATQDCRADELLAELMKSDADGDQQLSQPEADASKRFQGGIFQAIDADHDGQLNEDELRKGIPMRIGRRGAHRQDERVCTLLGRRRIRPSPPAAQSPGLVASATSPMRPPRPIGESSSDFPPRTR